jgi:hypothetical protein
MFFEFHAGDPFRLLREMADRPLPKGVPFDLHGLAVIDLPPPDVEPRNKALEEAARGFADALLELLEARGRPVWGEPNYRLTAEEGVEMPAWVEELPCYPDRLVGWRRGKGKVAAAFWEHEGRIVPVFVHLAVVRWRPGVIRAE